MADAEDQERARERGEGIRAELLERLETGAQNAADLLPQLSTPGVSLSEVAFQLERLDDEGRASGKVGGPYQLA